MEKHTRQLEPSQYKADEKRGIRAEGLQELLQETSWAKWTVSDVDELIIQVIPVDLKHLKLFLEACFLTFLLGRFLLHINANFSKHDRFPASG